VTLVYVADEELRSVCKWSKSDYLVAGRKGGEKGRGERNGVEKGKEIEGRKMGENGRREGEREEEREERERKRRKKGVEKDLRHVYNYMTFFNGRMLKICHIKSKSGAKK